MDSQYLELYIPDTNLVVSVKLDSDGVVIDVFDTANYPNGANDDTLAATTWKTYSEFGLEVKPIKQENN